jgi:hypothetical protein
VRSTQQHSPHHQPYTERQWHHQQHYQQLHYNLPVIVAVAVAVAVSVRPSRNSNSAHNISLPLQQSQQPQSQPVPTEPSVTPSWQDTPLESVARSLGILWTRPRCGCRRSLMVMLPTPSMPAISTHQRLQVLPEQSTISRLVLRILYLQVSPIAV